MLAVFAGSEVLYARNTGGQDSEKGETGPLFTIRRLQ